MSRVSRKPNRLSPAPNTTIWNSSRLYRQDPFPIRDTLGFFPPTAPLPPPSSDIIIGIFWGKKAQGSVSQGLFSVFHPDAVELVCKWTKVNYMWPQLSDPPHARVATIVLLHAQLCNFRGHHWKLASRVYSAFTVVKELLCESQPALNWILHLKLGFTFFVMGKGYSISSVNLQHKSNLG